MRLLLDAMISKVVANQLRRRGYDVQAVQERSMAERRLTDPEQLARATAEGRTLVTYNFHDFVPLSQQWAVEGKAHGGLVEGGDRGSACMKIGRDSDPLPKVGAGYKLALDQVQSLPRA